MQVGLVYSGFTVVVSVWAAFCVCLDNPTVNIVIYFLMACQILQKRVFQSPFQSVQAWVPGCQQENKQTKARNLILHYINLHLFLHFHFGRYTNYTCLPISQLQRPFSYPLQSINLKSGRVQNLLKYGRKQLRGYNRL